MDLFIKNWNNCATITMYQFIQASHMTYKQFKQMVKDLDTEYKWNVKVLEFIEPVIKKYWTEPDIHKFPDYNKPKAFNKKGECLPWGEGKLIEGVDTEYAAVDFFTRMLLRLTTLVDIMENMQLKDYWNLSKAALLGKALTKNGKPLPSETVFMIDYIRAKQMSKYLKLMSKYTDTIPLIGYEIVFFDDDQNYDYHVFTYIRENKHKFINLNSNLQPKIEKEYHAMVVRKTSGNWRKEPPIKVIDKIEEV